MITGHQRLIADLETLLKDTKDFVFHDDEVTGLFLVFDANSEAMNSASAPVRHTATRSMPGTNFFSTTGPSISVTGSFSHRVTVVFVQPRLAPSASQPTTAVAARANAIRCKILLTHDRLPTCRLSPLLSLLPG